MSKQMNRAAAGGGVAEPASEELSAVLAACNERLIDLQRQALDIALAEAAAIQSAWLAAASAMAGLLPQPSDRANAARLADIAGAWLRVIGQTQTAWLDLVAATPGAGGSRVRHNQPERRRLAVVINFPDRRRAV